MDALAPPGGGAPAAPAPDSNAAPGACLQQALGPAEVPSSRQWVYFTSVSWALHVESAQRLEDVSREIVARAVRDAFENLVRLEARGGRAAQCPETDA